jgi:hypothetical protein
VTRKVVGVSRFFVRRFNSNDTTGNFARYAWFLERKFSEWNPNISENINRTKMKQLLI